VPPEERGRTSSRRGPEAEPNIAAALRAIRRSHATESGGRKQRGRRRPRRMYGHGQRSRRRRLSLFCAVWVWPRGNGRRRDGRRRDGYMHAFGLLRTFWFGCCLSRCGRRRRARVRENAPPTLLRASTSSLPAAVGYALLSCFFVPALD
jgi:hypothetical protein